MAWDVDSESTTALMKDVGVSLLTSDDLDVTSSEIGPKPTPNISAPSEVPPGVNYTAYIPYSTS